MTKIKQAECDGNHLRTYSKFIGTGLIPDGYFGDRKKVFFLFHVPSGEIIVDWQGGLFKYQTPPADNIREAAWLIEHHPSSNVQLFIKAV